MREVGAMERAQPAVEVTLLAGIAVRHGGLQVQAASTRAVSLLAYLAVHSPTAQPRSHLAAVFWPDTADAQARTNLRRETVWRHRPWNSSEGRRWTPTPGRCFPGCTTTGRWSGGRRNVHLLDVRSAAREHGLVGRDFSLGGTAVSLGEPQTAVRELELACELSAGSVSLSVGSRPEIHARAWSAHAWWLLCEDKRAAIASADAFHRRAREVREHTADRPLDDAHVPDRRLCHPGVG